ncbi:AraC family transcriptional regulator [Nocardioides pocheonensis]|uniref:AraC family transcriptional regulator n=1 Tax=Nocardioides pocheonensis TaxID=661485 RepID=A0A3N0GMZ0_9ACTN|nr:AraC family transcriptional regulator [Nocardioides pocheonensis]RNM13833.1 AraC family transcriptional regulator [Nocardioides pocheonensis]
MQLLEPAVRDWDFPRHVRGIAVLVEHAGAHGLAPRTVLAGTGLRVADLARDDLEATAEQELRVVRNLLRHGSGPARSGVVLGRRYRVETFGIAGYALVSSRTLLDAMNFALRFMDLTFTFSIPHARVEGDTVVIETWADTLPADVRDFLVARDLAAVEAVLRELFLGSLPTAYDGPRARVTLPASYLDAELPRANPAAQALAAELCADLAERRRDASPLAQQVRILLAQRLRFDPGAGGVADALGVSERTLRRRLAAEGAGFQALLDEVRASLSARLLATGGLSVAEVAERLGYAEAASFIHAHRRWLGATPGATLRA